MAPHFLQIVEVDEEWKMMLRKVSRSVEGGFDNWRCRATLGEKACRRFHWGAWLQSRCVVCGETAELFRLQGRDWRYKRRYFFRQG
jgi:hypothetical protein